MKVNEVSFFQTKYFKRRLSPLMDEQFTLDEETHREAIEFFNYIMIEEQVNGEVSYSDERLLTTVLLDVFPNHFVLQPDFSTEIYVSLLLYYDFLHQEKKLSVAVYTRMVLFFQSILFQFLEKMALEAKEEGSFADFNAQFLDELGDLVEELEFVTPKKIYRNNVIQMPTRLRGLVGPTAFLQVQIAAVGVTPPWWYQVVLPVGVTYDQLQEILQALFAWKEDVPAHFKVAEMRVEDLTAVALTPEQALGATVTYERGEQQYVLTTEGEVSGSLLPRGKFLQCVKAAPSVGALAESSVTATLAEINRRLNQLHI